MAHPPGPKLVERDHRVLALLGLARYLSADQLGRLVFPGRHPRVVRRRLARLAATEGTLDPLVRVVPYRRWTGAPGRAFALTEAGHAVATQLVRYSRPPAADVGAAFLEHALALNDLLVGLVMGVSAGVSAWTGAGASANGRAGGTVSLGELPFRWLAESGDAMTFDHYDRATGSLQRTRIRPDATLELGEPRRRLFLECETGTQAVVSADPTNTGATAAKLRRYGQLLAGAVGQHDPRTPYSLLWPDGFAPGLVFVAPSERRRDAIRKLLADPARKGPIRVAAYTVDEAIALLTRIALARPAEEPTLQGQVSITRAQLDLLREALAASPQRGAAGSALALLESLRVAVRAEGRTAAATSGAVGRDARTPVSALGANPEAKTV